MATGEGAKERTAEGVERGDWRSGIEARYAIEGVDAQALISGATIEGD